MALLGAGRSLAGPWDERFRAPREFVLQRAPRSWRYRGDDWQRWNVALKETLLPSQEEGGSWRSLGVYARYAGDMPEDSIFTTAMCVLSLEVY